MLLRHGDFDCLFRFHTKEDIQNWIVNSDSGYQVGNDKAIKYQ